MSFGIVIVGICLAVGGFFVALGMMDYSNKKGAKISWFVCLGGLLLIIIGSSIH